MTSAIEEGTVPVADWMPRAPAVSAEKKSAASRMPPGRSAPRRATARPENPTPPETELKRRSLTPATCSQPTTPAPAPETSIVP